MVNSLTSHVFNQIMLDNPIKNIGMGTALTSRVFDQLVLDESEQKKNLGNKAPRSSSSSLLIPLQS